MIDQSKDITASKSKVATPLAEELPKVAKFKPYYYQLKKGRKYLWCSCGLSKRQPFCDQSHVGTDFLPITYVAKQDQQEVLFCGCKKSTESPFCDGSHNNLPGGFEHDDPESELNKKIPQAERTNSVAMLDGGCFVSDSQRGELIKYGNTDWRVLISSDDQAIYQSLHYLEVGGDDDFSPMFFFVDSELTILVAEGEGSILISNKEFKLSKQDGVFIQANEAFSLRANSNSCLKLYLSVCPAQAKPGIANSMPDNFDTTHPDRVVATDRQANREVGDRFFQILIGKQTGSSRLTQFIGKIPLSMSAFHRHLYEESLVVLEGRGYMWTDNNKACVQAGDIIFLPRKQLHSLQCSSVDGMVLVGFIYPGDNPSINY